MNPLLLSLEPVPGEQPAGSDARHDPDHELVRSEIAKLSSVANERPDWTLVRVKGVDLLRSRSKDLLIATYVAYALSEAAGLDGASEGVALLAELITRYGQQLFPLRARARINALEWFLERLTAKLDAASASTGEQVVSARESVHALRGAALALLGDEAPSFAALLKSLERLELAAPTPAIARGDDDAATISGSQVTEAPPPQPVDDAGVDALLAPLGPNGVGVDATYDDPHIAVRNEIQKLQGIGDEQPDWRLVVEQARALLGSRSKDLTIAVYMTAALLEVESLRGLRDGLKLCLGLVERYWDSLWPPVARAKRRTSALEWLQNQLITRLPSCGPCAPELRDELVELAGTLAALFALKLPGALDLSPLQSALANMAVAREPEQPSPIATIAVPQGQSHAAATKDVVPTTIASTVEGENGAGALAPSLDGKSSPAATAAPGEDVVVFGPPPADPVQLHGYVLQTAALLVQLGRSRFEVDATDARAYRWLRTGLWLRWEKPPAANRRGRIDMDAPSTGRRADLQKAMRDGAWHDVLAQSEALLVRSPLWLDTHRLSVLALQRLGEAYSAASSAIEREARNLVVRLPELTGLQFADGTPLASAETLAWLTPVAPSPSGTPEGRAAIPEPVREGLLRGEPAAAAEFSSLLRSAPSRRASFRLRLELASMLEAAGRFDRAIHLYLGLERELDRYAVDAWEPDLACQVLEPLYRLLSAASSNGVAHTELPRICARLAQLTPTSLL